MYRVLYNNVLSNIPVRPIFQLKTSPFFDPTVGVSFLIFPPVVGKNVTQKKQKTASASKQTHANDLFFRLQHFYKTTNKKRHRKNKSEQKRSRGMFFRHRGLSENNLSQQRSYQLQCIQHMYQCHNFKKLTC